MQIEGVPAGYFRIETSQHDSYLLPADNLGFRGIICPMRKAKPATSPGTLPTDAELRQWFLLPLAPTKREANAGVPIVLQWVEGARSPGLHGPTTATVRCGLSRRGAIILMVFLVKIIFSSQAPKVTEGLMG